jgi:hypothetical protein
MDQRVASRRRTELLPTFQPTAASSVVVGPAPFSQPDPPVPTTGPPVPSSHVAGAGSAMASLNSSRAFRLCDRLVSLALTGSISPAANRR